MFRWLSLHVRTPAVAWVTCCWLLSSCGAYRFSNLHNNPWQQPHYLMVEAVYDTSEQILAHEILWNTVQETLARTGRVRLVSASQADSYLRLHLKSASVNNSSISIQPDPNLSNERVLDQPPKPIRDYPNTRSARFYSTSEDLSARVEVEIWDLETRKLLMTRSYGLSRHYSVVDGESDSFSQGLKTRELRDYALQTEANKLALEITNDFLGQFR